MKKPISTTMKLLILVVLAVMFGATMIGLSIRNRSVDEGWERHSWDSDKKVEETFTVQTGDHLIVDSDVGSISVVGTDSNEVSVRVFARGSDGELRNFTVDFNQANNTVRVEGKMRRRYFNLFNGWNLDVHFDIQVPRKFNLELGTSGGDIVVRDVQGKVTGGTSGGDLDLSNIEGSVRLSTSGGNVELQSASGDFDLETSGGNIRCESVSGSTNVETSGGNIEFRDGDGKLTASTSGGDIRVVLKDNKGIDLSTSGGSIFVRLPQSIAADVRAETSGGDVTCEFPFEGKLEEGSMRGKIKGGGNLINLETSGGDIVISSVEG